MATPILTPKPGKKRPRSASPPSSGRSAGGGLMGARIAGLPAPVLLGGVVLAIAIGLYLRHKASTTAAATNTAAPALADTGATGGGSASGDTSGQDLSPYQNLADSINGLTGILGGGGTYMIQNGGVPSAAPAAQSGTSTATPPAGSFIDPITGTTVNSAGLPTNTSYADLGITPSPISVGPPNSTYIQGGGPLPALATVTKPATIPAAPHTAATHVLPASTAPKVKPPISGYDQKSKSNLH